MGSQGEKVLIRTSIIGNWNSLQSVRMKHRTLKGFTLIEVMVILILIGIVLVFTIPRFQTGFATDDLKASTRKMIGLIRGLKDEAVREHKTCFLHFDLESDRYWIDSTVMSEEERARAAENALALPGGVHVLDVWFRDKGKQMVGQTAIRFTEKGYIQPSVIHLGEEDERVFTLVLSPFLGKVKIYEEYIEFEGF
jgi:prepilin-type N-terminal cleavage/methylation domain-containing protein